MVWINQLYSWSARFTNHVMSRNTTSLHIFLQTKTLVSFCSVKKAPVCALELLPMQVQSRKTNCMFFAIWGLCWCSFEMCRLLLTAVKTCELSFHMNDVTSCEWHHFMRMTSSHVHYIISCAWHHSIWKILFTFIATVSCRVMAAVRNSRNLIVRVPKTGGRGGRVWPGTCFLVGNTAWTLG